MIDYLHLAAEAGFGGVLRRAMMPRIKALVDLAIESERAACIQLCIDRGNFYKNLEESEFREGQMDGAYSCAELISSKT